MSWTSLTTFPPALTEVLGVTLSYACQECVLSHSTRIPLMFEIDMEIICYIASCLCVRRILGNGPYKHAQPEPLKRDKSD
jgi:hypothetical protein